jgi:hypothetical protein
VSARLDEVCGGETVAVVRFSVASDAAMGEGAVIALAGILDCGETAAAAAAAYRIGGREAAADALGGEVICIVLEGAGAGAALACAKLTGGIAFPSFAPVSVPDTFLGVFAGGTAAVADTFLVPAVVFSSGLISSDSRLPFAASLAGALGAAAGVSAEW